MPPKQTQPNLIVIFSDQQRWDTVGCYGQALPLTPHLDRMAAAVTRFVNAFTNQPVCGPTRAVLQTGRYATETGCWRNGIALRPDEDTIARRLSAAGYDTGYIGKWHLASTRLNGIEDDFETAPIPRERRGGYRDHWLAADVLEFTSHGYDGHLFDGDMRQIDFTGYRAHACTRFALDYLRTRTGEKPFFLFLSYIEPHHQNDRNHYEGPVGSRERWKDYLVPGDLAGTAGDWREEFPDYLGCVHAVDEGVGAIRAELARSGLADNTVVLYTSDHGSHFRTRNQEYKRSCHDGSIRIPFIACGPGFARGATSDRFAELIDLPPTLMRAAGADVANLRGRALQDAASAATWRDETFVQISESQVGRALRTPHWTYAVAAPGANGWETGTADRYCEEFLYDLRADPHQRSNLVEDPAFIHVRREMADRLAIRMRAAGEAPARILPPGADGWKSP